jgi:hypothetical protein
MSIISWSHSSWVESRPPPRLARALWIVVGVALGLSMELRALQSPGQTIRSELEAAAVDLEAAPAASSAPMLAQIRRNFHERGVTVDGTLWPLVSVTFHQVDASTCQDAVDKAARIEGLVVVALQRYRAADECRDVNDMTWRILP